MISFAFLAGDEGVHVFKTVGMRNIGSRVSNSGHGDSLGFSSVYSLGWLLHAQTLGGQGAERKKKLGLVCAFINSHLAIHSFPVCTGQSMEC